MKSANEFYLEAAFNYLPSEANCFVFITLFSWVTLLIFSMNIYYKTAGAILVITGAMEVIGYDLRLITIRNPSKMTLIVSEVLLIMAPILLALVNYLTLAKLMEIKGKAVWCFTASRVTKIFLSSDILSLIVQASAGGLLGMGNQGVGLALLLVGLGIQFVFFSIFIILLCLIAFGKEFRLWEENKYKQVLICLFMTSACVQARNVYRIVDYASPPTSDIATHEVYFIVFESSSIFLCFLLYAVFHFGRTFPTYVKDYSSSDPEAPKLEEKNVERV